MPTTTTSRKQSVVETTFTATVSVETYDQPRPEDEGGGVPSGDGPSQFLVLAASILAAISFLVHLVSFRISTRVMDHWCRPPMAFSKLSVTDWLKLAIPLEDDGSRSQCTRREPPDAGSRARIVSCEAWDFDLDRYGNNIVSQWRLVCDRRWLIEMAVLVYMTASAVCLPLAGVIADRAGRKVVMDVSLAAFLVTGLATSISDSYFLFVALRIVVSVTSNTFWLVLYAVLYEVTTPARRELYCFAAMAAAAVVSPLCLLALSRLRFGWEAVHLVLMIPVLMTAALFVPVKGESPAWLMVVCESNTAKNAVLTSTTRSQLHLDEFSASSKPRNPGRAISEHLTDHTGITTVPPNISTRFVLTNAVWAACAFAFNQVTLNDVITVRRTVAAAGIAAMVPMHLAVYACVMRFGAKRSGIVTMLVFSVLCLVLTATISEDRDELNGGLLVLLRIFASVFIVLLLLITVKQFPAHYRCTCLCSGFALGRVTGSIGEVLYRLAPQHRRDIMVAFVGVGVALASVATEYLPSREPRTCNDTPLATISASSRRMTLPADEFKRLEQESPTALRKSSITNLSSQSRPSEEGKLRKQHSLKMPMTYH